MTFFRLIHIDFAPYVQNHVKGLLFYDFVILS